MTLIQWVSVGSIAAALAWGIWTLCLTRKKVKGIQWDHVERQRELTQDAAEYAARGMPKNAEACMRSAEEEHKKTVGDEDEVAE